MPASDWTESRILADWAEKECQHVDLIASWETLLAVYDVLGFDGPDNDEIKLAEFKQVVGELNKFLTRMKNGINKSATISDAVEFLMSYSSTTDMTGIRTRSSVAYNKLKQRWIVQSISVLQSALMDSESYDSEEGERDD
jgi:hypothetical protein